MSLQTQTTQTKTESEEMEMKTKEEFGFYIRKTVIKNLLSAHRKIADRGNVKSLIILTKFILKISNQFNDMLIDLGLEENDNSSDKPPDAFWHCNAAEAGSKPGRCRGQNTRKEE